MKEQNKTQVKELNKMDKEVTSTQFKILVIRMLKELSEDLNSIKKIYSEMKDTLIEIKNNLQGNNTRVDEAKNQINDLEHKEAKNNQSEQQQEKRIPQKQQYCKQPLGQLKEVQHSHHSGARRRRERTRN